MRPGRSAAGECKPASRGWLDGVPEPVDRDLARSPPFSRRSTDVKKIITLVLAGLAALAVVRRQRSAKAEADLWREATTPTA